MADAQDLGSCGETRPGSNPGQGIGPPLGGDPELAPSPVHSAEPAIDDHRTYLAVDLGAGSGRVMLGRVSEDRLELEELHRFAQPEVQDLIRRIKAVSAPEAAATTPVEPAPEGEAS